MRYRVILLFYCVLFFGNSKIFAQQKPVYTFRHINQSDGLLHARIIAIVQDGKGYIWILTPNGLQRYDGSRFVNYPYDLNNPNWLTDTRDADLFADKKKNYLWITNLEIQQFDLQKNKFTLYNEEKILKDNNFKFESYTDAAGNPWLAGDFGIFYHFIGAKKFTGFNFSAPFLTPGKSHIFFTDNQNGNTWFVGPYGLSLFDKATAKVYSHDDNPINNEVLKVVDKKRLNGVMKDSENNIWTSTIVDSFYKYNSITKKLSAYSLAANTGHNSYSEGTAKVRCFFEDNHHTIWIATDNAGLLQYNRDKDNFTKILNEEKSGQGLHYNYSINCIFQDEEENIWLGTDKGINIFNPYRQHFQSIHHEENNTSSIPNNEILNFIQAGNGDIITCTWGGGITVYDNKWNFKKTISFPGPYEYNLVWSLVQNDDGNIWIGCQHGFIHIYNPITGSIKTIHPPEVKNNTIWDITKDKKGNIWMGLNNGKIAEWSKQENKFYAYNDSLKGIAQAYSPVFNIFFDSKDRCWVSTETGFKQFDTEKRMFSAVYVQDKNNLSSISTNFCSGIEEYDDSTLLIGTIYGGLNIFNPGNKTFTQLSTKNGLPSNTIHAIKKDAEGYIWFTTDYDLYKYKPADKKFIHLNTEPGTINTEFKSVLFYQLQDGKWITATTSEIICFYTKNNFYPEKTSPKVEVTGFKVFDNSLSIDSLLDTGKPVRLFHDQNFLTIEFALLDFSNLQQTNYYHRLDGVDKEWVSVGTKKFASYTNLEPGEYTFSVKADNGNKISGETIFKIIITPPFWGTWWFKALVLLLTAGIIYFLVKRRIELIRHGADLKQKISETEMMALRSQMNPHFIFNCINSIDALIQSNDKYYATVYLNKFAKLLRNILDSNKQNTVPFSKDIDTLKLYIELEELRHENKFKPVFSIDNELLNSDYKVPPLIIQPFVENAILHGLKNKEGNEGILSLEIKKVNDKIQYIITDNGIGRAAAGKIMQNKESHYGMQISYDRIKLFNKEEMPSVQINDLYNNEIAVGTEVTVNLNIF